MDFQLTQEQQAFQRDVREFFQKELPADHVGSTVLSDEDDWESHRRMKLKLAERGWLGLPFPREYGGLAAGPVSQAIFLEQYAYHRAAGLDRMGVKMLGPTLIKHGSEEQIRLHLPRVLKGEVEWCQGYSEPNAGSDLASLQTRAVRDGDDYVINGSKIWTTKAEVADWIFVLARTDPNAPKHKGISFFVCPMDTPGVSHRPITNMLGVDHFSQTWFENVRVPARYLIGGENRGWYVAMALLDFERSGVEWSAYGRRMLADLLQYCRETKRHGKPLSQDPLVRHLLGNTAVELEVGRLVAYRIAWMHEVGQAPNREASLGKLYNTELIQRTAQACMRIIGQYGQLDRREPKAPIHGLVNTMYLGSIPVTIFSGTSEVQRGIIATRGLGLPRD